MRVFFLTSLLILTSCGTPPEVPVSSRDTISVREQTERIGGGLVTHVRRGDTLYSIAFGAGLSPADVAAWNGINQDDVLLSGKKIRLTKPLNFKEPPVAPRVVRITPTKAPERQPQQPIVKLEEISKSKPITDDQRLPIIIPQEFPTNLRWQWPTKGKISSSFSIARGNKGVDIAGRRGQDVVSSEAGKVVYAGNGLRGYGNLLIIKHNEKFLSAYAHNDNMFVKEGQFVKQGQRISAMGVAKNGNPVLHFEIRSQGKPVNPTEFLPKR